MTTTRALDFTLAIEATEAGGYITRLLRSPKGRAAEPFEWPVPPVPSLSGKSHRQLMEVRGQMLFDALFVGKIRRYYREALTYLHALGEAGKQAVGPLRIRVAIDPRVQQLAPLFDDLDLEILFDGETGRFLTRSQQTTLVRDLEQTMPLEPLVTRAPLRLLFIAPRQTGSAPTLDHESELDSIRRAWGLRAKEIEIERLENPTFRGLRRYVRNAPVHILHFVGHGRMCSAENEGLLSFEGRDGSVDEISGSQLADILYAHRSLRLVVVSACESGSSPAEFPARSVAASLIRIGVPSVVAMRSTIPDASAIEFCSAFYEALAEGLAVDEAVTEARFAIDDTEEVFRHWSTPALFMSSTDGHLLKRRPPSVPNRLGIRSFFHEHDDLDRQCDHLLDLTPHFDGRYILERSDWQNKIVPELDHFLCQHISTERRLSLRLDAHLTISFTAGWMTGLTGADLTLRQAGVRGFEDWRPEPTSKTTASPSRPTELLHERVIHYSDAGRDVVIALGVTVDNLRDVQRFVERELAEQTHRLIALSALPAPGSNAVRGADHALAITQAVRRVIERRSSDEQLGTIHLFLATPNALSFYLGQHARGWGRIQLYEWDFDLPAPRRYRASLSLEPSRRGRRRPSLAWPRHRAADGSDDRSGG